MAESLNERLGETEGCKQPASDLVNIHLANPAISSRYVNSDPAALMHGAATFFIVGV
jgi:hemoglobin